MFKSVHKSLVTDTQKADDFELEYLLRALKTKVKDQIKRDPEYDKESDFEIKQQIFKHILGEDHQSFEAMYGS